MGSFRDYFDVAGGVRSGLTDDPPWWAPGAIAVFTAVVAVVLGLSLVMGVGGGDPPGPVPGGADAGDGTVGAVPGEPASGTVGGVPGEPASGTVGDMLSLADRTGTFRQVPRAAVAAARDHGARSLNLPVDDVRHQLVSAGPGRVELTVASLDGARQVRVLVVEADGGWQVP